MFKLPRLKSNLAIVNAAGQAKDYFLRFWNSEVAPAIENQEKRQDQTDQDLADAIIMIQDTNETIEGVLNGTIPFTELNVQNNQVRAFLDKTFAGVLTDYTGLGTGIVRTNTIQTQAVTNYASAYTSGTITLTGTTTSTVQTLTYTSTGTRLNVRINFYLTVWHPAAGGIQAIVTITRTGVANIFTQTFDAVNGDLLQGWQTIEIEDNPPAGTCTYAAEVTLTNNGAATQTAQSRFMGVTELKR